MDTIRKTLLGVTRWLWCRLPSHHPGLKIRLGTHIKFGVADSC